MQAFLLLLHHPPLLSRAGDGLSLSCHSVCIDTSSSPEDIRFSAASPHPSLCARSQQDRNIPVLSPSRSPPSFSCPPPPHPRCLAPIFSFLRQHSDYSFQRHRANPEPYFLCHWLRRSPTTTNQRGISFGTFHSFLSYLTLCQSCTLGLVVVNLPFAARAGARARTQRALKAFRFFFYFDQILEERATVQFFKHWIYEIIEFPKKSRVSKADWLQMLSQVKTSPLLDIWFLFNFLPFFLRKLAGDKRWFQIFSLMGQNGTEQRQNITLSSHLVHFC